MPTIARAQTVQSMVQIPPPRLEKHTARHVHPQRLGSHLASKTASASSDRRTLLLACPDWFQGQVGRFQFAFSGNLDGDLSMKRRGKEAVAESLLRRARRVGAGHEQV